MPDDEREKIVNGYNKKLPQLTKQYPQVIARFSYFIARQSFEKIRAYVLMKKTTQETGAVPDEIKSIFADAAINYYSSLHLDPLFLFSFRDAFQLFNITGSMNEGMQFFEKLVEEYPNQPAFLFAAGYFSFKLWQGSEKKDNILLTKSLGYLETLYKKVAPDDPRSFPLIAHVMEGLNLKEQILPLMRMGWGLWKDREPTDEYYIEYLSALTQSKTALPETQDVLKHALKAYGGPFAQKLSKVLDDSTYFSAEGDAPPDLLKAAAIVYARQLMPLSTTLDFYTEAHPHLDGVRVMEALYLDLANEATAAQASLSKIHSPNSDESQREVAYTLKQLLKWISTTQLTHEDVIDWIVHYLNHIQPLLTDGTSQVYAIMAGYCALQYLGIHRTAKAEELWQKAVNTDTPIAVEIVVSHYKEVKTDGQLAILEMMDHIKDRLAPAVREWMTHEKAHFQAKMAQHL